MIEISTGPPTYTRPSFPEHRATSPVPLRELFPNDLKNMFDSDQEGDDDVEVVDVLPARLLTTAQPADDLVISETEPESDEEVTVLSVRQVAGPSRPSTVLPPEDLSLTEPESDEEPQPATVSMWIVSHSSPVSNKQSRLASNVSSLRNPEVFVQPCVPLFLARHPFSHSILSSCHSSLSLNYFSAVQ